MAKTSVLAIGWNGADGDDTEAGSSSREWRYAASLTQDESLTVRCWLNVWRAGTAMKERRDEATALLEAFGASLRANISAVTAAGIFQSVRIADVRLAQVQSDKGTEAIYSFDVYAKALI